LASHERRCGEWIGTEIRTRKLEGNRVLESIVIEIIGELR